MPLPVARPITVAFVLILTCLSFNGSAEEIASPGRVTGVLQDRSGAVIQSALVEIRASDLDHRDSAVTTGEGRYAFGGLPPGRYTVAVSAPGFEPAVRRDVEVAAASVVVADFVLEVARTLVTVEVTAPMGSRPLAIETDPRQPRQPIPAHDGADYLKTIPGFSVIRKGGADGDPVLRGMAGSRLGILLDGENILGGCGSRMDPPTAYVFPESYDRITILKGPQTVAHGPGNSAGVVLFERDRQDDSGVHVFASPTLGLFGRNDQAAELKVAGRELSMRLSATRSAMDDYEDGSGNAVHSHYERWSTNATLGWMPDAATRIELSGALSDGNAAYADRMMDGVKFLRQNGGLRVERRNLSSMVQSLEGQVFYNYVDHVMDNYSLRPFTASMMMPARSVSNPDRRTVGGKVNAALQLSTATVATVGIDWQGNRHAIRSSSNELAVPFENQARVLDADFDNFGVFGELTVGAGRRHRLVSGGRVDRWSGRDHRSTVALSMGSTGPNPTRDLQRRETLPGGFARYELSLTTVTTLYAGVGHTRRTPDYWELVSKESATSLSAFGTRPEHTTQLDTGVMYRQGRLSSSVAMFVSNIADFILIESNYTKAVMGGGMTGMGGMGGTSMTTQRAATIARNVDASTWGGEATAAWSTTAGLKFDTSVAWVRGENDTDGRPLAQLPPLEGRVGVEYAFGRWSAGGLTRLVAAQHRFARNQGNIVGQDLGPTPSFAVVSLNAGVRLHKLARLTAGVDNLLDTTYAEFISRTGASVPGFITTTRVNEPGRLLWLKLDLRR